jgi:Cdc6-like AAA superfamily ATPase
MSILLGIEIFHELNPEDTNSSIAIYLQIARKFRLGITPKHHLRLERFLRKIFRNRTENLADHPIFA